MGAGSVTSPKRATRPSWKLKPPHDKRDARYRGQRLQPLPSAEALFLLFDWPENAPGEKQVEGKGAWLQALETVAPVSDASGKDERSVAHRLHLDRPSEARSSRGRSCDFLAAVSRGHVSGGPPAPPRRQGSRRMAMATVIAGRATLERQHSRAQE